MPQPYCWVKYCENYCRPNPNVVLYPIPYLAEDKAIWSKAFGIPIDGMNEKTMICSLHFIHKAQLETVLNTKNYSKIISHAPVNNRANTITIHPSKTSNINVIGQPPAPLPCITSTETLRFPSISECNNVDSCRTVQSPKIRNLLACDLFLDCQEEDLSQIQQNFQTEEWLNYCKYNATINDLPSIKAVNGSDIMGGAAPPSELPVLVFTNAPKNTQLPQTVMPTVNSMPTLSRNSKILFQNPPAVSSNSPLLMPSPPTVQPPAQPIASTLRQLLDNNVFPVKLVKATNENKTTNDKVPDEEIFPLIFQESLSQLVQDPSKNAGRSILKNSASKDNQSNGVELITTEVPQSSPIESGNSRSISPDFLGNLDFLNNLEIDFQETELDSVAFSKAFGNSSQFLSTDVASDDSNGPKIVDVKSGDDGAKVFYNDKGELLKVKVLEVGSQMTKEKDNADFSNDPLAAEKNMPKTVTQWSIFSMQKTIAVISSGTREATTNNLLNLRPNFPPATFDKDTGINLRNRLRDENFLTLVGWWLAKKRYLPFQPPCEACGSKVFLINSCCNTPDDLCWTCQNCKKNFPVKRPKLFERFPMLSLEELLLLTYHWACKSLPYIIKKDVHVHEDIIFNYFSDLQKICGDYVSKHCAFGKRATKQTTVEVSAVKLGNFFILCAYCRLTKLTRLKALTTEEACGSVAHIKVLENMLAPHCTLITWKKICDDFLPSIHKVCADPNVHYINSSHRHILNASKYLGKTLIGLFQNINHDSLSLKDVQGYLDELQWRERLGRIEESAFWNILNEISKMNETYYTEVVFGEISRDRYFYKQDISFQMRWGPTIVLPTITKAYPAPCSDESKKQAISETVKNTSIDLQNKFLTLPSTSQAIADQIAAAKTDGIAAGKPAPKHPISINSVEALRERNFPSTEKITSKDLLSVKIIFDHNKSVVECHNKKAFDLGLKLKHEGYIEKPVQWLMSKKLINDEAKCYVCKSFAKLVNNPKFPDGVSWLCQRKSCKFENKFKRPGFFAMFGFQMEILFAIVYHWAVQSDYKTIIKAIPVNEFTIICVHRQLQKVCANVTRRPCFVLGGKKNVVEVALVKFANCFILGAMERDRKLSRFKVFSVTAKLHIDEIRKTLVSWLYWESTVIVNSNKYFGAYCMEEKINLVFSDKSITDVNSKGYHTLTITNYLQTHMKLMFASVKVEFLSAEVLQIYLDELVWRERYGKSPEIAFRNILQDIFISEYKATDGPAYAPSSAYRPSTSTSFLPHLPEAKVVLEKLPEHVILKYLNPDPEPEISDDEVEIISSVECSKEIKEEVISDDEEEVEIIKLVPGSEMSLAPSSSSTKNQNDDVVTFKAEFPQPQPSVSFPKFPATTDVEVKKRYSDKCYSHKRRFFLYGGSFQCIECKEIVSEDHFIKMYSCDDCKYCVYTTCCQKAFAQHRSYVLFGRKPVQKSKESKKYHHNIFLSEWWYCSCGYASKEGNKLATHLVKCMKSTCYSSYDAVGNIL